jgi:hypothetical protein
MDALSSLASITGWGLVRGSGNVQEETYAVSGIDRVALATIGTVHIEIGENEGLRVVAEDNLLEQFRIEVMGDTVHIESKEWVVLYPTQPVEFFLTTKALNSITVSGSGDVDAPALEADDFEIDVKGSGSVSIAELVTRVLDVKISGSGASIISGGELGDQCIDVVGSGIHRAGETGAAEAQRIAVRIIGSGKVELGELDAVDLDVRISGAGKVSAVGGKVDVQKVNISGSGQYRCADLTSGQADVKIVGSGSARVWAGEHLCAKVRGSGNVYYRGAPTTKESVTGSGGIGSISC